MRPRCSTSPAPSPPAARAGGCVRGPARALPADGPTSRRSRCSSTTRTGPTPRRCGSWPISRTGSARCRSCSSSPHGRPASPAAPRSPRRCVRARPRCCARARSATTRRRSSSASAVPEAVASLCRTCHALTGGNPFFLRELAGALREAGPDRAATCSAPRPTASSRRSGPGSPASRAAAQRLAGAAAIVGDGALLRHAAALADLDDQRGRRSRRRAARGPDPAEPRALRFVHPIIRSAVHEQLSPAARSAGHERAARMLAAEDAAPERVAAHLLATEPHALGVGLRPAPRRRARGGAARRTRRLRHLPAARARGAASLESRPAVLLELGLAESLTLDRSRRSSTCGAASRRRRTRSRGCTPRARSRRWSACDDPPEAVEIVERALAASPDADPAAGAAYRGAYGQHGPLRPGARRATVPARRPATRARRGRRARRRAWSFWSPPPR